MRFIWCLLSYLFIMMSSLNIVQTVPPEYCLSPLNRSDCNLQPTPVFYYYKPGSRCEVDMWRGCPTANKFENEYLCSLHCLFRMKYEIVKEQLKVEVNECEVPLNTEQCTNETATVYTHVNGSCIEATWSGCPTVNKFEDKDTCDSTCHVEKIEIEKELEKLEPEQLEEINESLKLIVEEELMTTTEATTEATTEVTTETTTEAKEEETTTEHVTEPTTVYESEEEVLVIN